MNYIHQLQDKIRRRDDAILEAQLKINQFMAELATAKFTGVDIDGARNDWMSTSDIMQRLKDLRASLQFLQEGS